MGEAKEANLKVRLKNSTKLYSWTSKWNAL